MVGLAGMWVLHRSFKKKQHLLCIGYFYRYAITLNIWTEL